MEICFVDKSDYKEVSAQSDTGKRRWKKSRPSCFILELRAVLNIEVEDSNESSREYSECLSEEDEVASDLQNDSDPQGSSFSENITENMEVKTKAKANSSKKKPRASTSKQSRKKGIVSSES